MNGRQFAETHEGKLAAVMLLSAAVLRFAGLGDLPPFIDESGHLALLNPIHPSFFQLGKILGQYIFRPVAAMATDGLFALRLLIAVMGVATTAGVYFTGRMLGGGTAGLCAGFLWALQPMVTFHDRLAIHDPMISFFHIWSVYALMVAMRRGDWRLGAVAGVLSGLSVLVKMPMLPLAGSCLALGFAIVPREQWKERVAVVLGFGGGFALPMLTLFAAWDQLFGSNIIVSTGLGATEGSMTLLFGNLGKVVGWLAGYNSVAFPIVLVGCAGLAIYRRNRLWLLLLALFVIPVLGMSFLLNTLFARYLLATLLPLALLMGLTIPEIVFAPEGGESNE